MVALMVALSAADAWFWSVGLACATAVVVTVLHVPWRTRKQRR